jgi:membrane-associated phospholipid phosphatase
VTDPPQRADAVRRRLILVVAGIVGVLVAVLLKLADSVRESDVVTRIDSDAMKWVVGHRVGWLTQIARFFTFLGSAWVVTVVVVGAAVFLVVRRRGSDALLVVLSAAGTALLVEVMKHGIDRPRPPVSGRLVTVSGAAFPSGHAAQSVACFAALAIVAASATRSTRHRVLLGVAAGATALAIGTSRVYLGVHWPTDVVSGWLLASGWLLVLLGVREVFGGARGTIDDSDI